MVYAISSSKMVVYLFALTMYGCQIGMSGQCEIGKLRKLDLRKIAWLRQNKNAAGIAAMKMNNKQPSSDPPDSYTSPNSIAPPSESRDSSSPKSKPSLHDSTIDLNSMPVENPSRHEQPEATTTRPKPLIAEPNPGPNLPALAGDDTPINQPKNDRNPATSSKNSIAILTSLPLTNSNEAQDVGAKKPHPEKGRASKLADAAHTDSKSKGRNRLSGNSNEGTSNFQPARTRSRPLEQSQSKLKSPFPVVTSQPLPELMPVDDEDASSSPDPDVREKSSSTSTKSTVVIATLLVVLAVCAGLLWLASRMVHRREDLNSKVSLTYLKNLVPSSLMMAKSGWTRIMGRVQERSEATNWSQSWTGDVSDIKEIYPKAEASEDNSLPPPGRVKPWPAPEVGFCEPFTEIGRSEEEEYITDASPAQLDPSDTRNDLQRSCSRRNRMEAWLETTTRSTTHAISSAIIRPKISSHKFLASKVQPSLAPSDSASRI